MSNIKVFETMVYPNIKKVDLIDFEELIPIYETDKGEKVVVGRELHESLGVKAQFTDWIESNLNNVDAVENSDYEVFQFKMKNSNGGRPSNEYTLKLDIAKEICMIAGANPRAGEELKRKSKQYRKYFIEIEKRYKQQKQLSPMEQLRLQYQVIETHDAKLNDLDNKVQNLENNMVIEYGQEVTIKKEVDKRVKQVCFGNESPAYANKTLRAKVYRTIWRDYKDYFNITSYHNTLKKDFDTAMKIIRNWSASGGLLREIQVENTQLALSEVAATK